MRPKKASSKPKRTDARAEQLLCNKSRNEEENQFQWKLSDNQSLLTATVSLYDFGFVHAFVEVKHFEEIEDLCKLFGKVK